MNSLSFSKQISSWVLFILLVVVCLLLYKDYGISWDEPVQRGIGRLAYDYVNNRNPEYMQMQDRIYGVGFELPLIALENFFNLTDTRDVYLLRHLVNALFFSLACFIFYRMNLRLFDKTIIALVPTLMLIFSPRIFGHAFFNSKDLPFMCMGIFCFHALHKYLLKPSWLHLIILSMLAGMLINFRIMGILFVGIAVVILGVNAFQKKELKTWLSVPIFLVIAGITLYSTWPFLWDAPVKHFKEAYVSMSKFPWNGEMLFKGEVITTGKRQAEYLFTWIGITVPVLYLVMSLAGLVVFIISQLKHFKQMLDSPQKLIGWAALVQFAAPIAAVIVLKSVLYDEWRQLYFIYPFLILFSGFLMQYAWNKKPAVTLTIFIVIAAYIGLIGLRMVNLHPYEQVYFNETVPKKKEYIAEHYEMDYWGTSFYEGLKYLTEVDHSDTIPLFMFHSALKRNVMLLPEKDRKRIYFPQGEGAEAKSRYYLTTRRFDKVDIIGHSHYKEIIFTVERENSAILRIWKH